MLINQNSVRQALEYFNRDGSFMLTAAQVTEILQSLGNAHQLTELELELALKDLGLDDDGSEGLVHISVLEHWIHTGELDHTLEITKS